MKVCILAAPHSQYADLFPDDTVVYTFAEDADLVVFTGGEDIGTNKVRDAYEELVFTISHSLGVPMLGICRGAQFLHVMNGGRLHQHVEGHLGGHVIHTRDGKKVPVTSTHHQMMDLENAEEHKLLAWASIVGDTDPEVVYYRNTNSLCVQFHPEIAPGGSPCRMYFNRILRNFLEDTL